MNIILFVMVVLAAAFCIGVLVGSGLHTARIDRQYQRLAKLVRQFNELNAAQYTRPEQYSSSRFIGAR